MHAPSARRLRQPRACALLLPLLAASPLAAQVVWDGGGANDLFTTPENWVGDLAPANDGTAAIQFAGSTRTNPVLNADYSVASLTLNAGASGFNFGPTVSGDIYTLTIGSGGVTNLSTAGFRPANSAGTRYGLVALSANQQWDAQAGEIFLNSTGADGLNLNGHTLTLTDTVGGNNAIVLTTGIIGTGALVKNSANDLRLLGNNANTFSGGLTLNAGRILFNKGSAFGAGTLTWSNSANTTLTSAESGFAQTANLSIGNALAFTDTGSGTYTLNTAGGFTNTLSGGLSGTINERLIINSGVNNGTGVNRFTGSGSGFASNLSGGVHFREGTALLEHADAFGPGNNPLAGAGYDFLVGRGSNSTTPAALLATSGANVAGQIGVVTDQGSGSRTLGLSGSGAVTFSGPIVFGLTEALGSQGNVNRTLTFTGGSGTATFSGQISSSGLSGARSVVVGNPGDTGTVVFSHAAGNTYTTGAGTTTISAGTTLLVSNTSGSATSSGAVTADGFLGGTGIVDPGTGLSVTINSGGGLRAGDLSASGGEIGVLQIGSSGSVNDLVLAGGTYVFDFGASSHDQVSIFGSIAADPTGLVRLADAGLLTGGTFTIFDYTDGSLSSIAGLSIDEITLPTGWSASLFNNTVNTSIDVVISVIPEPSSAAALAGLGALGLCALRRRGRGRPALA